MTVETCQRGHAWTPENTYVRPGGWRECRACRAERRRKWKERTGWKSTEQVRRYRSDPAKAERDRQVSRAWKEANRERNRARDRAYYARRRAAA